MRSDPAHCRRRPRRALLALGAALLLPVGCGDDDATATAAALTSEEFIEVIVELREAEREALETDSAAEVFARRKAEILERHRTSEDEIRAFAEAATRDLQGFTTTWEEISNRLRRPVAPDSL
jgi:hypothetical protein